MGRPLALVTAFALVPMLAAADTMLGPAERAGLALTLTQDDVALVRDRRSATLDKGGHTLVIEGVARTARDGTALLSGTGLSVREQGFDLEGIDAGRLLRASLGTDVTLVWREADGKEREERARVLAADGVPVFQVGAKVVAGQPARILYDTLPPGMGARPLWRGEVTAASAGKREVELAYLAGGLSWDASYVAELAPAGGKLTLSAWASLANTSGMDFPQARIQVLAGKVNLPDPPPVAPRAARAEKTMMMAAMDGGPAAREAVGPHHLYTLAEPVTLKDGERRQVALLPPAALESERKLVLEPAPPHAWRDRWADSRALHPNALLAFRNTTGQPLPSGALRVFQRAKDGGMVFLGGDSLPAVPAGETATIALGESFDVTARRSQTDFTRISAEVTEAAWEVRLANAGDQPARVTVRETFGGDWLVVEESAKHAKENAFTASWTVTVPARGDTVLTYRARVKG